MRIWAVFLSLPCCDLTTLVVNRAVRSDTKLKSIEILAFSLRTSPQTSLYIKWYVKEPATAIWCGTEPCITL